ncbi:sensor histidine kinase YesM [Mobilisporobacter senegalensis]|uniref:Sensor histidine kinase YesM n=1 Tax=Mobilisporobacter senegalensis TaxID=1329262 RepID=A0A3N1X3I2_9FIRM|nr:sensor histidine kinase [Mobilisporobacter senegalensis]ROR21355.1 sensor histidine kinase YesM [Mobilisporobacter senegalensis]
MIEKLIGIIFAITELYHIISLNELMKVHFEKRNNSKIYPIIIWCCSIVVLNIINIFFASQWINLVTIFIVLFISCHSLYLGSIRNKIFTVIFICILGAAMEMIVACGMFLLPNDEYLNLSNNMTYQIFGSISSKILLFLVVKLINRFTRKHRVNTSFNYWISLIVISLGSIYIVYLITKANLTITSSTFKIHSMLLFIIVIFINMLIFFLFDQMLEETERNINNALFEQQVKYYAKQFEEREYSELETRKMRHDITNHYICLKEYAGAGDLEGLNQYIDNLINNIPDKYCKANSGNIAIDALINYKISYARQYNIDFDINLEIPNKLGIDQTILCVIIGNALDNAIEACRNAGFKDPLIKVFMKVVNNNLYINILNPFGGDLLKDKNGNIITTKLDKRMHGLGLESIKSAVEKYNGSVEIKNNNDLFQLNILLYCNS